MTLQKVNELAWVTDVISNSTSDEADVVVEMPREVLGALQLRADEKLLWTLLPNNLGFTVNKVQSSMTALNKE